MVNQMPGSVTNVIVNEEDDESDGRDGDTIVFEAKRNVKQLAEGLPQLIA